MIRRLIMSRLIKISTVCMCMSEFTRCPKLPDFTLVALLLLHFDVMWLLVICIFLMVPWADVQCVIVAFLGLTRLLFHTWTSLSKIYSELK